MTFAEAHEILRGPLRFGDEKQIKAVRVVELVETALGVLGVPVSATQMNCTCSPGCFCAACGGDGLIEVGDIDTATVRWLLVNHKGDKC